MKYIKMSRREREDMRFRDRMLNPEKYLAKIAWRFPYLDDTCEEWTQGTYWGEDGTYQDLSVQLYELVPSSGSVDNPESNPKLERFRKMSNAYYDLYNNGGTNTGRETAYYFPRTVTYAKQMRWNRCYEITEPKMDRAILQAAKEQGLV